MPATTRRALTGISGGLAATLGVLGAQVVWAATRPYPSFEDLDASGVESSGTGPWIDMVVLGDSTCTGPGLSAPHEVWVRQFARMLTPRFQIRVHSVAVGGAKTADVLHDQLALALARNADLAVVSVGGNDALRGTPLSHVARDLDVIARDLTGSAKVTLLSGLGDLGAIPRIAAPLATVARFRGRRIDRIHNEVGTRHGALVADQWAWSVARFRSDPGLFAPDQFHAAAKGHALWARVAYETIEPHLDTLSS